MSDRGEALLQSLQKKVQAWENYIQRCVHPTSIVFATRPGGEFSVTVRWINKNNTTGEYVKDFTRQFVFGGTFSLSPNAWAVERKACDHARDIVHSILQLRGVA